MAIGLSGLSNRECEDVLKSDITESDCNPKPTCLGVSHTELNGPYLWVGMERIVLSFCHCSCQKSSQCMPGLCIESTEAWLFCVPPPFCRRAGCLRYIRPSRVITEKYWWLHSQIPPEENNFVNCYCESSWDAGPTFAKGNYLYFLCLY